MPNTNTFTVNNITRNEILNDVRDFAEKTFSYAVEAGCDSETLRTSEVIDERLVPEIAFKGSESPRRMQLNVRAFLGDAGIRKAYKSAGVKVKALPGFGYKFSYGEF